MVAWCKKGGGAIIMYIAFSHLPATKLGQAESRTSFIKEVTEIRRAGEAPIATNVDIGNLQQLLVIKLDVMAVNMWVVVFFK